MKPLWPWQAKGVADTLKLLQEGAKSICVTSPTGMGKGRQIEEITRTTIDQFGGRVGLFTNRRLLTVQTGDRMEAAGIKFGYASADQGVNTQMPLTVCSVQTITSRVKREVMNLPHFDALLVDEAHSGSFKKMLKLYRDHYPDVATIGYTATPVGLKDWYSHLVIAGTKSEGRQYGALVPCRVYAPSEPDMKGVKMTSEGEYVQGDMTKRVMQCTVFADVFETWERTGGRERATMLFGPGLPECRWFAEEFRKRGITAEVIDGETSQEERDRIREGSRTGAVRVVCSFGVLREGADWPWVSHGILIQVCGAYGTFTQIVGRILRAFTPDDGAGDYWAAKTDAVLQDHAGAWWRHGSPNDDWDWKLDDTNKSIAEHKKKPKPPGPDGEEQDQGICCPQCQFIRQIGPECPACGYRHSKRIRMVRTEAGQLVQMTVPRETRKENTQSPEQKKWTECLFRCAATGRTFAQALGVYRQETGEYLPLNVSPRPESGDPNWNRPVGEVYPNYVRRKPVPTGTGAVYQGSVPGLLAHELPDV